MKTEFRHYPAALRRSAAALAIPGKAVARTLHAAFVEPRSRPPRFGENDGPGRVFGLLVSFDGRTRR